MGAGASLAASCDLRIAADDAFFAVPAARLGLGYDPRGIKRCLRVFGTEATREMIFTAERLPARRAGELGVVSALVPANDIDSLAAELAHAHRRQRAAHHQGRQNGHSGASRRRCEHSCRSREALCGSRCQRGLCGRPPRLRREAAAAIHRELTRHRKTEEPHGSATERQDRAGDRRQRGHRQGHRPRARQRGRRRRDLRAPQGAARGGCGRDRQGDRPQDRRRSPPTSPRTRTRRISSSRATPRSAASTSWSTMRAPRPAASSSI